MLLHQPSSAKLYRNYTMQRRALAKHLVFSLTLGSSLKPQASSFGLRASSLDWLYWLGLRLRKLA